MTTRQALLNLVAGKVPDDLHWIMGQFLSGLRDLTARANLRALAPASHVVSKEPSLM